MKSCILNQHPSFETVREMIDAVGSYYSADVAYSFRDQPSDTNVLEVRFSEFRSDVYALGAHFIELGLTGKHCALVGKLTYSWVRVYFALLASGAVVVPLDRDWQTDDLISTIRFADCEALFLDADLVEKDSGKRLFSETAVDASSAFVLGKKTGFVSDGDLLAYAKTMLPDPAKCWSCIEIRPDALAEIVFTSGTTGKGKGVMLSQRALLHDIIGGIALMEVTKKTIAILPPHHAFGSTVNLFGHLLTGTNVYISSGLRYLARELKSEKPGHLILVPLFLETFYRKITATVREQNKEKIMQNALAVSKASRRVGIDLRRKLFSTVLSFFGGELQTVICGGAPLSQEMIDAFDAWGIRILNGYGITECAPLVSVNLYRKPVPGSVGCVLDSLTVKIDNPDENGEGEVLVKGDTVMLGYYKNPTATEEAMDKEGYFRTGDYGRVDGDNRLFITGRSKNLIILSNGKNVYPEEIETALSAVPGVSEVVVYEGISERGSEYNAIVAEIYPDAAFVKAAEIGDIQTYLKAKVDAYNASATAYKKVGMLKVRTEEFPKNTLRKIKRFEIDRHIR